MLGIPLALGLLSYTYVGYPALIAALGKVSPLRTSPDETFTPFVSVLFCAYDAEAFLEDKLDSMLGLDWPKDAIEVLVYSDGSKDGTNEILARRAAADPRIRPFYAETRGGKPRGLNLLRKQARGEVLLMTDVRQRFEPSALRKLVRHLADPSVGCVSGNLVLEGDAGSGAYWRYEKWIREREARFRSVPGVTGAIYVLRAKDLEDIPEDTILDDVMIPTRLRLAGKKVLFEPAAIAFDRAADDDKEFSRKVRTLAGNFQIFARMPDLLVPGRNPSWLEMVSHKAMRLAGPFLMGSLAASSIRYAVAPPPGASRFSVRVARGLAVGQLAFYAAAIAGPRAGKLAGVARTFVVMNAAAAVGLYKHATNKQRITW